MENLITIRLVDDNCCVIIDVDRFILCENIPYFRLMLKENFIESTKNEITINVIDSKISKDIITNTNTNFIHYEIWEYILIKFKCLDYFGININLKLLLEIEVPNHGFELLLEVIDIVGLTSDTINLIIENLPENYDLRNFSNEFIEIICDLNSKYYILSIVGGVNLKLWNFSTGKLLSNFSTNFSIKTACLLNNNNIAICYNNSINIEIRNYRNNQFIINLCDDSTNIRDHIVKLCYVPTKYNLITGNNKGVINIWNTKTFTLIKTIRKHKTAIKNLIVSPDNKYIVSTCDRFIKIWNTHTYKIKIGVCSNVDKLFFSTCEIYLITFGDYIKIWDFYSGKLLSVICWYSENTRVFSEMVNFNTLNNLRIEVVPRFRGKRLGIYSRDSEFFDIKLNKTIKFLLKSINSRKINCHISNIYNYIYVTPDNNFIVHNKNSYINIYNNSQYTMNKLENQLQYSINTDDDNVDDIFFVDNLKYHDLENRIKSILN
ncbi:putative BTB/POZ domain and WD-repeat protein [Cotonvirus japonicus]|uniref:BTB/POZ domain and WD-repeat protein n=1 Tax=Cotonvirus japonicus TaxID=2811091 RepID=A0ABM7NTP4_9VIRU|nr:putative BTB/POZ domain and WD-repeat protein [Cotonvirus japonicus]BCS83542.1 putative BTB/POZ domain and WD-repeat protein [Cotonvirus japonicus]